MVDQLGVLQANTVGFTVAAGAMPQQPRVPGHAAGHADPVAKPAGQQMSVVTCQPGPLDLHLH
jgi:hypothetical protein